MASLRVAVKENKRFLTRIFSGYYVNLNANFEQENEKFICYFFWHPSIIRYGGLLQKGK